MSESQKSSKSENLSNYAKSLFYLGSFVISIVLASFYMSKLSPSEEPFSFYSQSKEYFNEVEDIKKILDENYTRKEYNPVSNSKAYLITFNGSSSAEEVDVLRKQIDILVKIANPETDVVLLNLTSPGGTVTGYSLASNQLDRLKRANIKLVAMVDLVAASGGYMMASVADQIIAAPNSIVGSIGVVAEFPNFEKLLGKLGVEWKQYTAGDYKRTVGVFSGISKEAENHFKDKLEDIHKMFKDHVLKYRPNVKVDEVFSGDNWTAQESNQKKLGLVDSIATSDDYIISQMKTHEVYNFDIQERKSFFDSMLTSVVKIAKKEHFKMSLY